MAPFVDPATWYAGLPACYVAAGMLLTDRQGRVLLVKPNYRDHWGIPGGVAEEGEPPHRACEREISEELGLNVTARALLAVDFVPADSRRLRSMVYFIFDGGTLPETASITLQEEELDAHALLIPEIAAQRMAPEVSHRLPTALAARTSGCPAYLPYRESQPSDR
jgi:8-oxo-dGTP diphosphatase